MDSFPDLAATQKSYERPIEQRVQEAVDGLLGEGRRPSFYQLALRGAAGECSTTIYGVCRCEAVA